MKNVKLARELISDVDCIRIGGLKYMVNYKQFVPSTNSEFISIRLALVGSPEIEMVIVAPALLTFTVHKK